MLAAALVWPDRTHLECKAKHLDNKQHAHQRWEELNKRALLFQLATHPDRVLYPRNDTTVMSCTFSLVVYGVSTYSSLTRSRRRRKKLVKVCVKSLCRCLRTRPKWRHRGLLDASCLGSSGLLACSSDHTDIRNSKETRREKQVTRCRWSYSRGTFNIHLIWDTTLFYSAARCATAL